MTDIEDKILEIYRLQLPYLQIHRLAHEYQQHYNNTSFLKHIQCIIQSVITCSNSFSDRFCHLFGHPNYERVGSNSIIYGFDNLIQIKKAKNQSQSLRHEMHIGNILNNITTIPTFRKTYALLSSLSPDCLYCQFIPEAYNLQQALANLNTNALVSCFLQIFNALSLAYKNYEFTHYDLHSQNVLVRHLSHAIQIPYYASNGKVYNHQTNIVVYIIDFRLSYAKNERCGIHPDEYINTSCPLIDVYTILTDSYNILRGDSKQIKITEMLEYFNFNILEHKTLPISYRIRHINDYLKFFEQHYYHHIKLYQHIEPLEISFEEFWTKVSAEPIQWTLLEYYYALSDLHDSKFITDDTFRFIHNRYSDYYDIDTNIEKEINTILLWDQELHESSILLTESLQKDSFNHITDNGRNYILQLHLVVKYKRTHRKAFTYLTALKYVLLGCPSLCDFRQLQELEHKINNQKAYMQRLIRIMNNTYQEVIQWLEHQEDNSTIKQRSLWKTKIYKILHSL